MRTETEIAALHQRLLHRHLAGHDEAVGAVVTILNWTLNRLVPDHDVEDIIDAFSADGRDPDLVTSDIIADLPDAVADADAPGFIKRLPTDTITAIGAAARKLDRLCKAELKERKP